MDLNCKICQSELHINESGRVVYCEKCDRTPDRRKESLGGLLDAIKGEEEPYQALIKRMLGIDETIDEATDEVTIQYHCLKCERPTKYYGWCIECEDQIRETM